MPRYAEAIARLMCPSLRRMLRTAPGKKGVPFDGSDPDHTMCTAGSVELLDPRVIACDDTCFYVSDDGHDKFHPTGVESPLLAGREEGIAMSAKETPP